MNSNNISNATKITASNIEASSEVSGAVLKGNQIYVGGVLLQTYISNLVGSLLGGSVVTDVNYSTTTISGKKVVNGISVTKKTL